MIQHFNHEVTDPDQAWLLSEFIRYIEDPKSGALDFEDMGPSWVTVRNGAANQTLRANDPETLSVVARFDQLLAFCGMELSRHLGVHVSQRLSKAELDDQATRLQNQAAGLARGGQLSGALNVPNAAVPVEITVELRANRVDARATIAAPTNRRASARVTWLLNQLKGAPPELQVVANVARAKSAGRSYALSALARRPEGHRGDAAGRHPLVQPHPQPERRHQARPGPGLLRLVCDLAGRCLLRRGRPAAQALGSAGAQAQGGPRPERGHSLLGAVHDDGLRSGGRGDARPCDHGQARTGSCSGVAGGRQHRLNLIARHARLRRPHRVPPEGRGGRDRPELLPARPHCRWPRRSGTSA